MGTQAIAQQCDSWTYTPTPTVGNETNFFFDVDGTAPDDIWAVGYWNDRPPPFRGSAIYTLIQRFDGTSWTVVPSPNPDPDPETPYNQLEGVAALARDDAVAVGIYTPVGSMAQALALRWNGGSWSVMNSPSAPGGSALFAIDASPQRTMWAAGLINDGVTLSRGLLARRNGNSWTTSMSPRVGTRTNAFLGVSALRDDSVWCVGYWGNSPGQFRVLLQKFDGASWTTFNVPSPGSLDSLEGVVALADDDVWAVGYWYHPAEGTEPLIMHFNGTAWSQAALPFFTEGACELRAVTARSASEVYASGTYADVNGTPRPFILRYNGASWEVFPEVGTFAGGYEWFRGMTTLRDGTVWAVGQHFDGSVAAPLAVRLDVCCIADQDNGTGTGLPDGGVTIEDLLFYLGLFDRGEVGADVDDGSGTGRRDGGVTIDDLMYFLVRFSAGC